MSNFTGKVALVTGAAHGIGKAIAEKFAKAGANTVIVDFNYELGTETAEQITRDYQQQSIFIQADVSNAKDMEKVREETFKQFGRIDILVLNAGVAFANKVNDISYEEWQKTLDINLSGLFNTVKPFYNDFLTNKGSIVYISSGSALSGTGGGVSYPASKAGGEGLMRGLAKELGPKGVNVNSIAPRLITVEDVANLTLFLADKDNSYIQGQTILLDGGRTIA